MIHELNFYTYCSTDDGGVFKAKGRKQKAAEVEDDKDVKTEVPIDKRKAHTVKVRGLRQKSM